MKQIIMLAGMARSGKDSLGKFLKQIDPTIKLVSFAGPMKQIISDTMKIDLNDLEDWKNDGYALMHGIPPADQEDESFELQTYREILQRFGTEAMKPIFGDDVWASVATKYIDNMFNFSDTVVITDFRFQAEHEYLYEYYVNNGVMDAEEVTITTVKVDREMPKGDTHISERDLDEWPFDYQIINDGSLEDLKDKANKLLEALDG
jgi:hypothetical protein